MAAVATPAQAVDSLHPLAAQVLAAGYPATLFGFTPTERAYWYEPNLPWLAPEQMHTDLMPLDYRGQQMLLCVAYLSTDNMAPRFPRGCGVQTAPVYEKQQLVVGRVYTYSYFDRSTGQQAYEMGRLVKIGGNCLEVKADNSERRSFWVLREDEHEATWDVREVTHYVSYPGE